MKTEKGRHFKFDLSHCASGGRNNLAWGRQMKKCLSFYICLFHSHCTSGEKQLKVQ